VSEVSELGRLGREFTTPHQRGTIISLIIVKPFGRNFLRVFPTHGDIVRDLWRHELAGGFLAAMRIGFRRRLLELIHLEIVAFRHRTFGSASLRQKLRIFFVSYHAGQFSSLMALLAKHFYATRKTARVTRQIARILSRDKEQACGQEPRAACEMHLKKGV
jgi:hypothetical protein